MASANTNALSESMTIKVSDSLIRADLLLRLVAREIAEHNNTDFDNTDALVHAVRNELSELSGMLFPDLDAVPFAGEVAE